MSEARNHTQSAPSETLLTVHEAAEILRVSPGWVRSHANRLQPRIPFVRIGKLLRFRLSDIEEFVSKCKV
jgi:excisionase family DNA binding protein